MKNRVWDCWSEESSVELLECRTECGTTGVEIECGTGRTDRRRFDVKLVRWHYRYSAPLLLKSRWERRSTFAGVPSAVILYYIDRSGIVVRCGIGSMNAVF